MTKYNFLFCIQACLDLYKKIILEPLEDETRLIFPLSINVKLIERNNSVIKDMSYMFYKNSTLDESSNFSKFNEDKISNLSHMFCKSSLLSLPDISKLNTINVTDMSYLFSDCTSLISIPDLSKWKTNNLIKIDYMFFNCSSLKSLPNIFQWLAEWLVQQLLLLQF